MAFRAALPAASRAHPPLCVRSNLAEKGIHEVSQRRFVLVSADHPIVSAVRLQCLSNTSIARHAKRSPLLRRSRRTQTSFKWGVSAFHPIRRRPTLLLRLALTPFLPLPEISMMPEGLVKISQTLYESILPLVRTQVESQIKGAHARVVKPLVGWRNLSPSRSLPQCATFRGPRCRSSRQSLATGTRPARR